MVVAAADWYGKEPVAPPATFVAVVADAAVAAEPTESVDWATYWGAVPLDVKT